ncbi:putative nudix hydrolase 7 [Grifola frondosa]|uniref:Putative nudix hydrolase 7 n=1 Tax=Grifola frondosa TaxID=5627 RepID=A0A1C7LX52_GRIFR|nr:putative nudix hydrolase 7 [Grifola frondosa]
MASGARKGAASPPRPSASVVIVNAQNEVLLVQRNPKSQSFAGAHVFPGGNYDSTQDNSLQITAIREVFEETGLLLASSTGSNATPSDAQLDEARESIHAQKQLFQDFLSRFHMEADVGSLLPFTQWITPVTVPRRFHTQFYVAFLNSALDGVLIWRQTGTSSDSGWRTRVLPPGHVGRNPGGKQKHRGSRETVRSLSEGLFGRMVINPRALPEVDPEGRTILTYEGDETRGGTKGRLHRCLARFGRGGVVKELTIQRNFDVFTEIEGHLFPAAAGPKL